MDKQKQDKSPGKSGAFSGNRRKFLKQAGGATAVSMLPLSQVYAASKSKIKIGYVSPRTGMLAVFAEPDPFILQEMRGILKNGLKIAGKKRDVEIVYKDTQSSASRAASVTAELILKDKVDLVVGASTPRTTIPVANQCELHGVPCITTDTPWQVWFDGRDGDYDKGFNWTWHFFFGNEQDFSVKSGMWDRVSTNKVVGAVWPNDNDGRKRESDWTPWIKDAGFKLVDPGRFQLPHDNFSTMIDQFKKNDVEVISGVIPPPAFTRFWTQSGQQKFEPRVVTAGKATEFPDVVNSLGKRGENLAVEVWWSPAYPFSSSLTGQTAAEFTEEYKKFSGNDWTMAMGFKHSLFEVAIDVLKRAEDTSPEGIRDAIPKTNLHTITGPVDFATGPAPNIDTTPLTGGQWQREGDHLALKIVENSDQPEIPLEAEMQPIKYS